MFSKLIIFCWLALALSGAAGHVLELDDRFLELEKEGMWLVMFYAPWCGHCRNMEPTWVEVGASMKANQPDVKVARIDATKYSTVASHYDIKGFPTIKFFKEGRHYDYSGARNKHSIIGFVNRAKGPSVLALSKSEELSSAQQKHEVFFTFVGKEEGSLYDMLLPITKDLFTQISFYTISKKLLPKDISVQRDPTLLVFKDSTYYELPADVPDEEFLKLWIETEQFVAYNQLTGMSYHLLSSAGRPFAIVVLTPKKEFNETFYKMALERKHPYVFCWIMGSSIVNSMTRSNISMPNVVVYDTQSHEYFVMIDQEEEKLGLTKENVEGFFQKIKDGVLEPKGGNGYAELIQKWIVEMVKFFVDLFKTRPIIASMIVIVPSILFSTFCVCLCQMKDEDVVYKMGPSIVSPDGAKIVELDYEDSKKAAARQIKAETSGTGEGLRKRAKDAPKKEAT